MYKILIADDEAVIREGISCLLDYESLGFVIAGEAANGRRAYQGICDLKPDVVFLDIRMPGMLGLEVIKKARADGFQGKIIILSGYSDFKYAQEAIRLGVRDYILKPLTRNQLEQILEHTIAGLEKQKTKLLQNLTLCTMALLSSSEEMIPFPQFIQIREK